VAYKSSNQIIKMMKKVIIFVFFQVLAFASFARSDTNKIEQYCQVIVKPRALSNKVTIDIDFDEEKSFRADTALKPTTVN